MNEARQKKLQEYGQNNIFQTQGLTQQLLQKYQPARKEINLADLETRSIASSRYKDSDTSSVYSMATSTTSYSMMNSSVQLSHRQSYAPRTSLGGGGGITNEKVRRDLERYEKHLAKKFKKEVDKQRRKLFGEQTGGRPKLESSYKQMAFQSKETRERQMINTKANEMQKNQQQQNYNASLRKHDEMAGNLRQSNPNGMGSSSQMTGMSGQRSGTNYSLNSSRIRNVENVVSSSQRKLNNLDSNLFKNENIPDMKFDKVQYLTQANWRNVGTNSKPNNNPKMIIDPFRERQKNLSSNVFNRSRDYSQHQPLNRKFVDQDNLYDQKRMNDPMYSDLFDQCMNTGGKRKSPIRKKFDEIGSVQQDWTNLDLESKIKKEYVNYNPRQQKLNEFKGSVNPLRIVTLDLSQQM